MVRKGYGRASVFGGTAAETVNPARAVQKRVFTVDVKMNERTHRTA
jgi:hypothetical protein